jgi:hypothetical protein
MVTRRTLFTEAHHLLGIRLDQSPPFRQRLGLGET